MKLVLTAREALDRGIWTQLCELKGLNQYAINEGMMDDSQEIELNDAEARELGFGIVE
jgi:hypothetical protein